MSNNLITLDANVQQKVFKSEALNTATNEIVSIVNNVKLTLEDANRRLALVLDKVEKEKAYTLDGFKSLADYGESIGLKRANTYMLAGVGAVYNDSTIPESIKSMTPGNVNEIVPLLKDENTRSKVISNAGNLARKTQKQLREYKDKVKAETETNKPKVVKTYSFHVIGEDKILVLDKEDKPIIAPSNYVGEKYFTLNTMKEACGLYNAGKTDVTTSKGKKATQRFLYVAENEKPYLVYFREKPNKESKESKKPISTKFTREELLALLASMDDAETV